MAMTGGTSKLVYTGHCGGNSKLPIKVYVYYKTSEYLATNTSKIYCGMYVTTPSGWEIGPWSDYYGSYVGTSKLTFDGTIPNFKGTRWIAENKTFDAMHNDDGSGNATIYWKWGINSSWGKIQNISGSFTITLPTIARASQPSCITYPNTTEDVGTIGDGFYIHMNSKSSNYRHTIKYFFGDTEIGTIASDVQYNYYFTMPMSMCDYIKKDMYGTFRIKVTTYNDTTSIGEKYVDFKAHVPDYNLSEVPTTISLNNSNSVINSWNVIVKGFTKLNWSVTPQPSQYSNYIDKYYLCLIQNGDDFDPGNSLCDLTNASGTSISGTTDYLTYTPGTYRIKMYVKDSRGKSSNYVLPDPSDSTKPLKLTIYDYEKPKIQSAYARRCKSDGTISDSGSYLSIGCSGVIGASASIGDRNGITTSYQWRVVGGTYSAKTDIPSEPVSGFSPSNSYEVNLIVKDTVGSETPIVISIPLGKTDFMLTPYGAGFGMYHDANKPETIQSAWDIEAPSMKLDGYTIADFPIEKGSIKKGDVTWEYEKMKSGVLRQWAILNPKFSQWAKWGNDYWYNSNNAYFQFGVAFLTGSYPAVFATNRSTNYATWGIPMVPDVTVNGFNLYAVRPTAGQTSANVYHYSVYAIGYWK